METPLARALHTLSGDPTLSEARQLLIKQMSDATLYEVIQDCLTRNESREVLENTSSFLLDAIAHQSRPQLRADLAVVEDEVRERTPEARDEAEEEGIHSFDSLDNTYIDPEEEDPMQSTVQSEVSLEVRAERLFASETDKREHISRKHRIPDLPKALQKRARISLQPATRPAGVRTKDEPTDTVQGLKIESNSEDEELVGKLRLSRAVARQAIPKIDVMLGLPSVGTFKPIEHIPSEVGHRLLRQLKIDYNFDADDHDAYRCIAQFGEPPECYNRCLNKLANGGGICTWKASNGKEQYACDFCVETGRLCARLPGGQRDKIAIHSIPSSLRNRVKIFELEFWLQKPQKAEYWKKKSG